MRLIDADAFVLDQMKVARISDTDWQMAYWAGVDDTIGDIGKAPTIDAVPVTHGKWIGSAFDFYCSVCGVYQGFHVGRTKHCPKCGAKMEDGR